MSLKASTQDLPSGVMGERRRATRLAVSVSCQAAIDDGEFFLLGDEIIDLSADGLLLRAEGIPALVGERVIVSFKPPSSQVWIDAEAEIVRLLNGSEAGAPAFGLKLLALNPFDRALLEATIDRVAMARKKKRSPYQDRARQRIRFLHPNAVARCTMVSVAGTPNPPQTMTVSTSRAIIVE